MKTIIETTPEVARARLLLFSCAKQVLGEGMEVLGIIPLDQVWYWVQIYFKQLEDYIYIERISGWPFQISVSLVAGSSARLNVLIHVVKVVVELLHPLWVSLGSKCQLVGCPAFLFRLVWAKNHPQPFKSVTCSWPSPLSQTPIFNQASPRVSLGPLQSGRASVTPVTQDHFFRINITFYLLHITLCNTT